MNPDKFQDEELWDSLVVDREGYVCGYIDNFKVESNKIIVNLYEYDVKKVETPDEEELIQRLLELAPTKGVFHQKLSLEEFYDSVRETLHLSNREPVTLELLVEYAKNRNIEIPNKTQTTKVKTGKGSINWSWVDKLAFTDLGRCILLKKAVEAEKRGIALNKKVDYKSTEYLSGRMVIDSDAKIVGSVAKFLVGNPPGILVNIERMSKEQRPDVETLKQSLIPSRFKDTKQLSNKVKKDLQLGTISDDDLALWAKRNKIDVQNKVIERRDVETEVPIDWGKISKIGDVVVLKKSIEVLITSSIQNVGPKQIVLNPLKITNQR